MKFWEIFIGRRVGGRYDLYGHGGWQQCAGTGVGRTRVDDGVHVAGGDGNGVVVDTWD